MSGFLEPLRVVDVAIAWMLLEGAIVCTRHVRRGESAVALWSLANALAGLMLLLTVRAALSGTSTVWLILGLTGALFAHLGELTSRRKVLARSDSNSPKAAGPKA
jgi:hypothetical protein